MGPLKHFLYEHLLSLMTLCLCSKQDVALNFNTASKEYEMKMSQGKDTFLELISKGVFVDKTLMIDAFIHHRSNNWAITYPSGWGKTINLDMLKMFFEMPLYPNGTRISPISSTPNYRLFKEGKYYSNGYNITLKSPLLISQPRYSHFIEEHLGQYPVIHWSFDDIQFTKKTNEKAIIAEINKKVHNQHKYLLKKFDGQYKDSFIDIPHLISRLNYHFQKIVLVFVHSYERFPKNKRKDFSEIDFLLDYCRTSTYYKNQQKTIFTGIEERANIYLVNNFENFYGFTSREMNLIYYHYSIPKEEQNLIEYWYGGYQQNEKRLELFHPSAICSYLNTFNFESFSLHKKCTLYMNKLLKLLGSLYKFIPLINGDQNFTCLCFCPPLTWPCPSKTEIESLYYRGYFTRYGWEKTYEIPNFQTANHMRNTMAPYCTALLFGQRWPALLNETCSVWDWFLLSDEATSFKLQSNMYKCYKLVSRYYEHLLPKIFGNPISNSGKAQHSVIISIMPSKKLHFVGWHYKYFPKNNMDDLSKTKILLSSGSRGIFIDIREDEDDFNSVLNQSSRYIQILEQYAEFHQWKDIKCVDFKLLQYMLEIKAIILPVRAR